MADQPTTPESSGPESSGPSGSRWEPGPDETIEATPVPPPTDAPYGTLPDAPAAPAVEERRGLLGNRAALAGAATALVLGGGLTGFVIGHSTAGSADVGFRPANFSGQAPDGEGFGGPPSFGDHDGDGDHVGQQPPDLDGDGNGSSGSSGSSSNSGTGTSGSST